MLARHRNPAIPERPLTDGVITGWGTIDGRKVFVFSQDFTLFGGALGEVFAEKIHKVMDLALKVGAPLIGINDGAGARIQEGVISLDSYGGIFHRNVLVVRRHPADQRDHGAVRRRRRLQPGHDRLRVHGRGHVVHVHHRSRRREDRHRRGRHPAGARRRAHPRHEVGRVPVHRPPTTRPASTTSATSCRFLPSNNLEEPPAFVSGDDPERRCEELYDLIPASPNMPYDMKAVIAVVVDDGDLFEYAPRWAPNIVCGFARLDGKPVGVVGNQPMHLAGVLDIESSEKAARFVRTCDAFNVPLLTFVDVPGFLPGTDQEYGGIIRHGAKLLYAYCESTVPRIQIVDAQGLRRRLRRDELEVDRRRPRLRLAVGRAGGHGPAGRGRDRLPQGDRRAPPIPVARKAELVEEYTEQFANPYLAAERGYVDDVIDPAETRRKVIAGFDLLRSKREELPQAQARQRPALVPIRTDGRGGGGDRRRRRGGVAPAGVARGAAAPPPRWRFAGRWWSKPVPVRRERPW